MKKGIVIIIILAVALISCKKFLKEEPYSILSNNNFYTNEGDANAALNGVFSPMQAQTYYGRTCWLISELSGEGLTVGANPTADRNTLSNYTYTGSNGEILNWWRNIYSLINRANDVITNVPAISMDTVRRNNIIGNARFLRALGYFELIRSFGDVPLTLTPTTASSETKPKKTPVAEIYNQIIADLIYAEANCFPENKITAANKGRVSSGAASAILAKVYLTRSKDATDNINALAACNKVISSNLYRLLPVYSDVFAPEKKNGSEHIFSVQFELPPSVGNITMRMMYPSQNFPGGSGSFQGTTVFGNSYAVADSFRKSFNLSTKAVGRTGTVVTVPLYYSKYKDVLWTDQSNNSRTNWIITRYADVLLMQSEALNKINPGDTTKFDGINAVRKRAGLTTVEQQLNFTNTVTSDDFVNALVKERGWELCMEGHRKWDLIRLGKIRSVLATKGVNNITSDNPLLPIPDSEKALNPNL
jgi:starch-binding outer membrane protein, SusD/RagB family